jgi:hypothetical protein
MVTARTLEGACTIKANCNDFVHSLNPRLAALRESVPFNHGDWFFDVTVTPRAATPWPDFLRAYLARQREPNDDDENDDENATNARNCADVLAKTRTVGEQLWKMSYPIGIFEWRRSLQIELDADDDVDDVRQQRAACVAAMEEAGSSDAFVSKFNGDADALVALVAEYGSLAAAILPDATATIEECGFYQADGDGCYYACFATRLYNFDVSYDTS